MRVIDQASEAGAGTAAALEAEGRREEGRRARCSTCARPAATCWCACVRPVATAVELLILQHPLEVEAAKGTARLLHQCLPGSRLWTGERFPAAELEAALQAGGRRPLLLYPDTPDPRALGMAAPPPLDPALLAEPAALRLVVLDGTWRKSRKMLYLNPALQRLPRLPLGATPPSHRADRYRIRKAHLPDQLSTLEASCHALAQIEGDAAKFQPLLAAMDDFVSMLEIAQTRATSARA